MSEFNFDYEDVVEALEADGIMQEPDMNWLIEYVATNYGGNLDNTSNWAQGKERLLIYTETTADSYDVYACTHEHNGAKDFGSDVYYYIDGAEFAERALDTLCQGNDVWIADHVWDEMEDDFDCEIAEWWSDVYDDLHLDKVSDMESDGGEYTEE